MESHAVLIERHTEAGTGRDRELEVGVAKRFCQYVLGKQQRTEQLCARCGRRKGCTQMGRRRCPDTAFKHRPAVEANTAGMGSLAQPEFWTDELAAQIEQAITQAPVRAMAQ